MSREPADRNVCATANAGLNQGVSRLGRGQFSHHRFRRGLHVVGLGQNGRIALLDEGGGRFVRKTGGQHELGFWPARR